MLIQYIAQYLMLFFSLEAEQSLEPNRMGDYGQIRPSLDPPLWGTDKVMREKKNITWGERI